MFGLMDQFKCPTGRRGRYVAALMNRGHKPLTLWGLTHVKIEPEFVILDVGCGGGKTVSRLAQRAPRGKVFGIDYSADMVEYSKKVNKKLIAENRVEIVERSVGKMGFSDDYFDLVVSNQVLEHVAALGVVLQEIQRVLRPGGKFCCLFPSREVIREVHCGIPIVHWFPVESWLRYPWMILFRSMGFGYDKGGKPIRRWASDFLECLDKLTFYRTYPEIRSIFLKNFSSLEHIEEEYIAFRLEGKRCITCAQFSRSAPVKYVSRWLCRRMSGLVLVATKA